MEVNGESGKERQEQEGRKGNECEEDEKRY